MKNRVTKSICLNLFHCLFLIYLPFILYNTIQYNTHNIYSFNILQYKFRKNIFVRQIHQPNEPKLYKKQKHDIVQIFSNTFIYICMYLNCLCLFFFNFLGIDSTRFSLIFGIILKHIFNKMSSYIYFKMYMKKKIHLVGRYINIRTRKDI